MSSPLASIFTISLPVSAAKAKFELVYVAPLQTLCRLEANGKFGLVRFTSAGTVQMDWSFAVIVPMLVTLPPVHVYKLLCVIVPMPCVTKPVPEY